MIELGEWVDSRKPGRRLVGELQVLKSIPEIRNRRGQSTQRSRSVLGGEGSIERHIVQCFVKSKVNITHIVQYFKPAKTVDFLRFFKSLFCLCSD